MSNYTDTQLKQALAKMLPDVIHWNEASKNMRWKLPTSV